MRHHWYPHALALSLVGFLLLPQAAAKQRQKGLAQDNMSHSERAAAGDATSEAPGATQAKSEDADQPEKAESEAAQSAGGGESEPRDRDEPEQNDSGEANGGSTDAVGGSAESRAEEDSSGSDAETAGDADNEAASSPPSDAPPEKSEPPPEPSDEAPASAVPASNKESGHNTQSATPPRARDAKATPQPANPRASGARGRQQRVDETSGNAATAKSSGRAAQKAALSTQQSKSASAANADNKSAATTANRKCAEGQCARAGPAHQGFRLPPVIQQDGFTMHIGGYLRANAATFQPNRWFFVNSGVSSNANPYVGINDGFALGGARFNLRASYRRLYLRLSYEGSVVRYANNQDPIGRMTTGLRAAYARYDFSPAMRLSVGRFKPPYDVESLTARLQQVFVNRALESRGVLRHEGFAADMQGFAPGRQLGLMLHSSEAARLGKMDLGYALALTNGNSGDLSLNDNDLPAVYGRATLGWERSQTGAGDEEGPASYGPGQGVLLGVSGFWNRVTSGQVPNLFDDRRFGAGVDLAVRLSIFDFRAQVLWSQTDFIVRCSGDQPCPAGDSENALGGHGQLGVRIPDTGWMVAYRYALLNPRWVVGAEGLADITDYDQVQHHTAGVRYQVDDLPLTLWGEYTHSVEQGGRNIPNDRFEAAMQVNFQ